MNAYNEIVGKIIQAERMVDWIREIEEMTGGLMPSERITLENNQKLIDGYIKELNLC